MKNKVNSVKLIAEFIIIVLGVLVALASDRWRETIQNSELKNHYISGLIADIQEDSLTFAETKNTGSLNNSARLVLEASNTIQFPDSLSHIIYSIESLQWYNPPVVSREIYNDLVSTGNLSLLSLELRRVLGIYYDRVTSYEQREDLFRNLLSNGYRNAPSHILGPIIYPELFDRIQMRREIGLNDIPEDWKIKKDIAMTILDRLRNLEELDTWIAQRLYVGRQHAEIYGDRMYRMSTGLLTILRDIQDGELSNEEVKFSKKDLRN